MKKNYLTKVERLQFSLSQEEKETLTGLFLGDLSAQKRSQTENITLRFRQGTVHEAYLLHLYELFKAFCSASPKVENSKPDKRTGKVYSAIFFNTYALPCFAELYNLFYVNGKKLIPSNIGDLLTPLGLAFWIGDDGHFDDRDRVVYLSTNSFSLVEVQLLVSVLTDKFGLKCTINKNNGGFRIRIASKSLTDLQNLLKNIMPPMMLYKIGL